MITELVFGSSDIVMAIAPIVVIGIAAAAGLLAEAAAPFFSPGDEPPVSGDERFTEQCYLLWNHLHFFANNINAKYRNFAIITGEPTEIINRLYAKPDVERLFNLKPYEASALVPKIRIFKQTFEDEEMNTAKGTSEVIFSDHTSKQSIENMTKSKAGRGDGIGIKSLDFELIGGSQRGGAALIKRGYTKVTLKFMFQNIEMLVERPPGNSGAALIDLITYPLTEGQKKKAKPCVEDSNIDPNTIWEPNMFTLKLVYGWAIPHGGLLSSSIKDVLRKSSTSLKLTLSRHSLDFKNDGTVELMTEYAGYGDTIMDDPSSDILWLGAERAAKREGVKKKHDTAQQQLEEARNELEKAKSEGDDDKVEEITKKIEGIWNRVGETDLEDEAEEAREEWEKHDREDKVVMYQRFLSSLEKSGKIYFFDLTKDQIKAYQEEVRTTVANRAKAPAGQKALRSAPKILDASKLTPADKIKFEKEVADGNGTTNPPPSKAVGDAEDDTPIGELIEEIGDEVPEEFWSGNKDEEVAEDMKQFAKENLTSTSKKPEDTRINYIYYGDLLDIAFEVLNSPENPSNNSIKALLGPISFNDPKTGQTKIINLADIAISLNKFLEWWTNTVVGALRSEFLLADFVRGTIKDVIHSALGEGCFENAGLAWPEPKVSIQPLNIPGTGPGGTEPRIPLGGRINVETLTRGDYAIPPGEDYDMNAMDTYMYIYAYSWSAMDLVGDPIADAKRGIYHLYIGSDRGLTKSMKFGRIDNAKLAASRAINAKCDLRHLREQFKVTVEMVGNSIFQPGQFIFINPSMMGVGDPKMRARVTDSLGLGGYYLINKVSGNINVGGSYVTTLEAIRADISTGRTSTHSGAPEAEPETKVDAALPATTG